MSNRRKLLIVLLQIALWGAFISLPYFMVPHQSEFNTVEEFLKRFSPQPDLPLNIMLSSLPFNILLISFFYIHHYLIFDKFIVTRRFVAYTVIVISAFILIFTVSTYFKKCSFANVPGVDHPLAFRDYIKSVTWFMLVLLASLGLKLLSQWQQAEERAKEIENEQLRTELSFLHAQINPHFLFNSLNTIYGLALKKSETAPQAVIKLSQMLRYVIDEASREKVSLEQEINNLENYIELQKLRSTSTLKVSFKVNGDISTASIAPLLLLPFVENAFKYGLSNHEDSPIDIVMSIEDKYLFTFTVKNKKFERTERHSTGIGIPNVQRRLALLYPGRHKLDISDIDKIYTIKLSIQLS
jgi:sensor histidine kinase YesM